MITLWRRWTRPARQRWDSGLVWYRLRYRNAAGPRQCLGQLARTRGCGRVALRWQPGNIGQLHVGIPQDVGWLLQQMAADYGFGLTAAVPSLITSPLAPTGALPWERPFLAHLVGRHLFVDDAAAASYFPTTTGVAGDWSLLSPPPAGVALDGVWSQTPPPPALRADDRPHGRWLLGHPVTAPGDMLTAPGHVNVYGTAAVAWMGPQLVQALAADHRGLVVIDGRGDLAARLKRSAVVTRLLGRGLRYLHLDGPSLAEGFDPLAAVPGEDEAGQRQRRRAWFRLMGVHSIGLDLLQTAPLTDLLGLQKWLTAPAQQRQGVAATALEAAISRLLAGPQMRAWLEWPVNVFADLPETALILAFPGSGWARQQLLLAALLAACAMPGIRLAVHGLPWSRLQDEAGRLVVALPRRTLVSAGPRLPDSIPVLTGSDAAGDEPAIIHSLLDHDPTQIEALRLLPPGVGVVCHDRGLCLTQWASPQRNGSLAETGAADTAVAKQVWTDSKPDRYTGADHSGKGVS